MNHVHTPHLTQLCLVSTMHPIFIPAITQRLYTTDNKNRNANNVNAQTFVNMQSHGGQSQRKDFPTS